MTARPRTSRSALHAVRLVVCLFALLWADTGRAHVIELAVIKLTELGEGKYRFSWAMRPNIQALEELEPIFPTHCRLDGATLDCGGQGLVGTLGFERLGAGQSAAMFKIRDRKGDTRVYTLTPAAPTADIGPVFDGDDVAGKLRIVSSYTQIGIEHILKGVDHLMFVLGLIWIATGRWMLLKTITAFTVAHSITLGAVTFGWVGVPEAFVNAMIALSIVFIGVEVLKARRGEATWTLKFPWVVSFGFGLLHGFGFANALVALGLPEGQIPLALLAFNLGVEIGQIAFVMVVLALAWSYRVMRVGWPGWAQVLPAYTIGGIAAMWFFQRTAILLGA